MIAKFLSKILPLRKYVKGRVAACSNINHRADEGVDFVLNTACISCTNEFSAVY
jgi:hypothetical protein